MGDGGVLRIGVAADSDSVRAALSEVAARFPLPPEEAGTVELVLAEAMNNVVEHAYAGRADGRMDLRIESGPDGLRCELRDRGAPLPEGRLPLGRAIPADIPLPDTPEGGFGWFLIRQLARDLRHVRRPVPGAGRGGENVLTFRLAVGPRPLDALSPGPAPP
ncbi:MAG: ATP-binding protein [Hasllibacter sp.]